jgi:hypothetical protein
VNGDHHAQANSEPAIPVRRRAPVLRGTLTLVSLSASVIPDLILPNCIAHRRSRTAVARALFSMAANGDSRTVTELSCAY